MKLDEFTLAVYENINEIMDFFDFEKVYNVMQALNWKWSLEDRLEVPETYDIRRLARELLIEAVKKVCEGEAKHTTSTGGFEACAYRDENNKIKCKLSFTIDSWENE